MQTKRQCYQIRIENLVKPDWFSSFEEISVQHTENGQTILKGILPDQTALFGVLMRIRDLGLTLVDVQRCQDSVEDK